MRFLLSLFLTLNLLVPSLVTASQTSLADSTYNPDELVAIKPELRDSVAKNLPRGMTEYDIEIVLPTDDMAGGATIAGSQEVKVTNTTGEVLTGLPFRLYANGAHHERNVIDITSVRINGADIDWELSVADSVATIPVDELAPNEHITIDMEFTLDVPVDEASHYGILNHSTDNETTVLAHWYPVLAGWDPDTGWMLKPSSQYGDPIFTDAGMYDVSITAPADRTLITSGVETDRQRDGELETVQFSAKPSRDFVIVTSTALESTSTDVDGTTVTSWHLPQHEIGGESVLEWTANALNVFNPLLGEYPLQQLHAVEASVFNAAAVELPQMFIVGTSFYTASDIGRPVTYFEFTVAHEVVHMWFYSIAGNNQYDAAFIDEGLTNYLSGDIYFRETYGESTGDAAFETFLYRPFQRMIESNSDVIVDHPTDDFPTASAYSNAVYTKAPVGFNAIHAAMGDEAFYAALQSYVEEYAWRVATPADLEAAFQAHTDVDIREIWSHWFERREGDLDIRGDVPRLSLEIAANRPVHRAAATASA